MRRLEWEEWYALACAYHKENNNLLVQRDFVTPEGYLLGRWIERQRAIYNRTSQTGYLTETQVSLLNKIGMVWKLEARFPWRRWIEEAERYKSMYGDLLIPYGYRQGECHLGNWIRAQRIKYAEGRLSDEHIRDLEALGIVWSVGKRRGWMEWYADAKAYHDAHGDLLVRLNYRTSEGNKLGVWIFTQRDIRYGRRRRPPLTAEQIRLLDGLGMVWDLNDERDRAWEQMYAWASDYLKTNGRLPTQRQDAVMPDGRKLAAWISAQRAALAAGRLSREKRRRLEALGIREPVRRRTSVAADMWGGAVAASPDVSSTQGKIVAALPDVSGARDGVATALPDTAKQRTVETSVFIKRRKELGVSDRDLQRIRKRVLTMPGQAVPGLGGIRKTRIELSQEEKAKGRKKAKGMEMYYAAFAAKGMICFMTIRPKDEAQSLSAGEKALIKRAVDSIEREMAG